MGQNWIIPNSLFYKDKKNSDTIRFLEFKKFIFKKNNIKLF